MPEFHFTGKATLVGVDFYITADTLGQAMTRARRGEKDITESDRAEMIDYEIDVHPAAKITSSNGRSAPRAIAAERPG